jgi:hypothetical protein
MAPEHYRKKCLQDNIKENHELQKKCEDKLRVEDDPKTIKKLEQDIEDIKSKNKLYYEELAEIQTKNTQSESIRSEINSVGCRELSIVINFIIGMNPISPQSNNTDLTDITDKISKNNLTNEPRFLLTLGLAKVTEVSHFIDNSLSLYPNLPQNLIAGFINKYQYLLQSGITGDELFREMHRFSYNNQQEPIIQAAGLAVLSYLFERCEIFEK